MRVIRSNDGTAVNAAPRERSIVFHHLPKTAGSTFRKILESLINPDCICPFEVERAVMRECPKDPGGRLYAGHFSFAFLQDYLASAIKLVFIRHPLERVVSQYYNLHCHDRIPAHWWEHFLDAPPELMEFVQWTGGATLEEFVMSENPYAIEHCRNYQTKFLTRYSEAPFYAPPSSLGVKDEELLAEAKTNLKNSFDFVGVQEEFLMSMNLFCSNFGLRPFGDLSAMSRNRNPLKKKDKYDISPEIRARILEMNTLDIELWRYARSLLYERIRSHIEKLHKVAARKPLHGVLERRKWTLSECASIRGFYWKEFANDEREFYWSGYEQPAVIEFEMPMKVGARYAFSIGLVGVFDKVAHRSIKVVADSISVEVSLVQVDGGYRLEGIATVTSPFLGVHTLKISSDRGEEFGEESKGRLLGIAVSDLTVFTDVKDLAKDEEYVG